MANKNGTGNLRDELNRMNPAASHAKLGDLLSEIIEKHNALAEASAAENKDELKIVPLENREASRQRSTTKRRRGNSRGAFL